METKDKGRLEELRTALKSRLDENDRIVAAFKVGEDATGKGDGVVVTGEQRDAFRRNLAEAQEIKGLIDELESVGEMRDYLAAPETKSAAVAAGAAGAGGFGVPQQVKTLGQLFTESEEFKSLIASGGANMPAPWEIEGVDMGSGLERKDVYTVMPTGTARPVQFGQTQRDPLVTRQQRTARVRDLFPVVGTTANLIDFFRVTGFTNNAAPVAERTAADGTAATGGATDVFGLKPRSSLSFALAQAPVRTIAHYEVAHRNVLNDEPQLRAVIDNELLYGLRLEEDDQILNGDGLGENLLGILNTPGVQAYTRVTADTYADALRRAATRVALAYYESTGFVLHPYDWETVELTKTSGDGNYVLATNVAIGAEQRVWRQPVVDSPAMTQGRFLTGAFGLGATLYDRETGNIRIAEQHADFFVRNAVAILAEERLALATKRPEAFVVGNFTPAA